LHRHDPRDVLAHLTQPAGVLQLTGSVLEAEVEQLLARLLEALSQLLVSEFY
jgi:hypothetical protein